MKYLFSALLLFFVGISSTMLAQAPVEDIPDEIKKQRILNSIDFLDTTDVLHSRIELYPDIMNFFNRSSNYPEDYNPYDQFLVPQSVKRGQVFLQRNEEILQKASDEFNIRPEIFVSFLRIESDLGEYTQTHQALGALVSIYHYTFSEKRKAWARTELEALLQLAHEIGQNPADIRSSYAGAIGLPQFLPTSFLEYSADGDNDGIVDLFNLHDAIWSIGNYLIEHGWHTDKRRATFLYNRSNRYVACIFDYANAL